MLSARVPVLCTKLSSTNSLLVNCAGNVGIGVEYGRFVNVLISSMVWFVLRKTTFSKSLLIAVKSSPPVILKLLELV